MNETVTLVIPGCNCAATLELCLRAACAIRDKENAPLREIIFVDDRSTDASRQIAESLDVRVIEGPGRGPGGARNTGFRAAAHPLVWFVDADCVAEPDALALLIPHMHTQNVTGSGGGGGVGGVSGSYGIQNPGSLLACLIHEEIIQRHLVMPSDVNFLATFNVLYRKDVLEEVGGFDERFLKGQDAELSFRVMEAGYPLRFERESRVRHFHEEQLFKYLKIQRQQGYWRVWLHLRHAGHTKGDSYSSLLDHIQPPLAMLSLACFALALALQFVLPSPAVLAWSACALSAIGLALAQFPLTLRITRRVGNAKYLLFAPMSFCRAYWRGVGLSLATLHVIAHKLGVSGAGAPEQS